MSQYNKNSGYGKLLAEDVHAGRMGKLFVVGKAGLAERQMLQEIFPHDPEGTLRFLATIDEANNLCTADAGDRIVVMPGHTETLSDATSLVLDVAGVSIRGLGRGTKKPALTFDTAVTASIPVSAADVSVKGIKCIAAFADIVAPFTVTAKNCQIECEFVDDAADENFLALVETNTTDNSADGLDLSGSTWITPDLATVSAVKVDGDLDGLKIHGGYFNLGVNTSDLPALATVATGKDLTNIDIDGPTVIRLNDANPLLITADTTTANTGVIKNCKVRHLDTAGELLVTLGTNIGFFDNKGTAAVDLSGYLLPAADA